MQTISKLLIRCSLKTYMVLVNFLYSVKSASKKRAAKRASIVKDLKSALADAIASPASIYHRIQKEAWRPTPSSTLRQGQIGDQSMS